MPYLSPSKCEAKKCSQQDKCNEYPFVAEKFNATHLTFIYCNRIESHNDNTQCRSKFSTPESIDEEVERLRRELFKMRIKFAKREEYKPAQKKALRKQVAQLLTIKREREIESGVDRRTAKNAEKRRLVEAGLGRF